MIHESASDWLLRIAPLVRRLNEESLGDCALPREQWLPCPGYEGRYEVSSHGRTRLTEEQVYAIRDDGRRFADVAADYGISRYTVEDIKRRRRWIRLPERAPNPEGASIQLSQEHTREPAQPNKRAGSYSND